jgi:hypothetical protein
VLEVLLVLAIQPNILHPRLIKPIRILHLPPITIGADLLKTPVNFLIEHHRQILGGVLSMVLPSMHTVVSTETIVTRTVTERKIDPTLETIGTVMVLTHWPTFFLEG